MNLSRNVKRRWLLVMVAIVALIGLFATAPARAADTRGGEDVVIGRGEVIGQDLYVAGKTVTIDGTVKGDVVAVGGQITINGTVEGDLLAAAQGVLINGTVGDDVRVLGQATSLGQSGRVGGDLAIGGMSLEAQPSSVVRGDVLVGVYQALLAGSIEKNLKGGMNRLELRGTVGGDVDIALNGDQGPSPVQFSPAGQMPMPSVPSNLTLADSARIGGRLTYHSPAVASVSPSARIAGGTAYDKTVVTTTATTTTAPAIPWLGYIQHLVGLLLVGLLLLWLLPSWTRRLSDSIESRPLPSLGWGLVAFVAFIALMVGVLLATIALAIVFGYLTLGGLVAMIVSLGILLSAALVLGYVGFVAYMAEIIVSLMVGRWLLLRARPAWAERPLAPLVLGLVLYVVLRAIPWLGPLVGLLVALLALGALWEWGRATFGRARPTSAPIGGLQPV
ncbi:MAG: polymer-forming cytoskeletal protein [Kouleothrix sp.]|nr:polymer-forming cytoskeletal protein [Kouleothrix sp.]